MKTIRWLLACLLSLAGAVQSATVIFNTQTFTGTANNRPITVRLVTQGFANGTNLVFGTPVVITPVGGVGTRTLLPGNYTAEFNQHPVAYPFSVPDSTNTYQLADLVNRGIYMMSLGGIATNAIDVVAGNNVTIQSNGFARVISSTGGGAGSQTPWTATINGNQQALTNAGVLEASSVTAPFISGSTLIASPLFVGGLYSGAIASGQNQSNYFGGPVTFEGNVEFLTTNDTTTVSNLIVTGTLIGDGSQLTGIGTNSSAITNNQYLPGVPVANAIGLTNLFNGIVYARSYGANPDGAVLTDVCITNGSAQIYSSSALWTAADVGKGVTLYTNLTKQLSYTSQAGNSISNVVYGPLLTTISSFQNASNITLAANSLGTVNLTRMIYGTDNTTAFQNAIDAVVTDGGEIQLEKGIYYFNGACQNPTAQNSVLLIPAYQTNQTYLTFRGIGSTIGYYTGYNPNPITKSGTILFCGSTGSGTLPSFISGNIAGGASWSSVLLQLHDLEMRIPAGANIGILNLYLGGGFIAERCAFVCDFWGSAITLAGGIAPTNTAAFGVICPQVSNSGVNTFRNCWVMGLDRGVTTGDHTAFYDSFVALCNIAVDNQDFTMVGAGEVTFVNTSLQANRYAVMGKAGGYGGYIKAPSIWIENNSCDFSNVINGSVTYHSGYRAIIKPSNWSKRLMTFWDSDANLISHFDYADIHMDDYGFWVSKSSNPPPSSNEFWVVFGNAAGSTNFMLQASPPGLIGYWSEGTNVYSSAILPASSSSTGNATNLWSTNSIVMTAPTNTGSASQLLSYVDAQHTAWVASPGTPTAVANATNLWSTNSIALTAPTNTGSAGLILSYVDAQHTKWTTDQTGSGGSAYVTQQPLTNNILSTNLTTYGQANLLGTTNWISGNLTVEGTQSNATLNAGILTATSVYLNLAASSNLMNLGTITNAVTFSNNVTVDAAHTLTANGGTVAALNGQNAWTGNYNEFVTPATFDGTFTVTNTAGIGGRVNMGSTAAVSSTNQAEVHAAGGNVYVGTNGNVYAGTFVGALSGNASTATSATGASYSTNYVGTAAALVTTLGTTQVGSAAGAVWATNIAGSGVSGAVTSATGATYATNYQGGAITLAQVPATIVTNNDTRTSVLPYAAVTPDAGTYWFASGVYGTNTLTLDNKYYYINASANCCVTNIIKTGCWAVLAINNTNAATTIYTYVNPTVAGIIGTTAYTANTNGLVVAAGKTAVYSFMCQSKTNYSNAVQQ